MSDRFDDDSYLTAYDHNYRAAYAEGMASIDEGASPKRELKRLASLLERTGLSAPGTRLLDLGCGDGTKSVFLAGLGYGYLGIDLSEAAVEKARGRARQAGVDGEFRVGNVLDLSEFGTGQFRLVLDAYCFHMLVLDAHRRRYFEQVRRVLADDGSLVLLAQRDEGADEGPVNSFSEFLERLGVGPPWDGVPLQKCVDGGWVEVPDKRIYLMARAQSLKGYRREFAAAGLRVEHQRVFGRGRDKAAFVLRKEVG